MLTEKQEIFLSQRKSFTKSGSWIGTILLLIVIIFWSYLFLNIPLLINPFFVLNQIEKGEIFHSTLALLATMGSMAFLIIGFVLIVLIVSIFFIGTTNERKLIAIINVLRKNRK